MKRAKHTLSHYRLVSGKMGELLPIGCVPVLPGDTVQMSTEALIRVSPLNTPVMHPTVARIHHWFVPNRHTWPQDGTDRGWEEFITGGPDGNNTQSPPTLTVGTQKKGVPQYLGCPPFAQTANAMPTKAYNQIFNSRYRDQLLEPEKNELSQSIQFIAWEKDYFSTARPFTQLGPDVSLPIGTRADVTTDAADNTSLTIARATGGNTASTMPASTATVQVGADNQPAVNLFADLSTGAVNVNDFRAAFSIQRYQEARMRYGARFTEYLRYLGITPSDSRIQEPEYLGGGTARLQFSEVLSTANTQTSGTSDGTGTGDLYGHGIAGARSNKFRKFFEEHGYIITLLSVRPKAVYKDAIHREFLKTTKEDYFQKELANLGQQEVTNKEIHFNHNQRDDTFGFVDRYDEYRRHPSTVHGDFRDTLSSWSLFRELPTTTALNESFIRCNPSTRIYQVESDDHLWCMVNNHVVARRMVPKRANPRIV